MQIKALLPRFIFLEKDFAKKISIKMKIKRISQFSTIFAPLLYSKENVVKNVVIYDIVFLFFFASSVVVIFFYILIGFAFRFLQGYKFFFISEEKYFARKKHLMRICSVIFHHFAWKMMWLFPFLLLFFGEIFYILC